MVSKRLKLYCFYCKYESSKYNKSNKFVKFKGKLKSICKFCNKNKHKTLLTKYKDNDTQCKICNNAVMYKKCIPCSICGHFFHGKCLDFNKLDITKIENICDFYMCPPCLQISLPAYVENEIKNTLHSLN